MAAPLSPGIRYANDFALTTLTLLSATGTFDLKNMMVELSYEEDIFNNTTSGYVMVSESMNYISLLNLNGNEYLRMTFSKDGETDPVDKLMRVYKVGKRKLEQNMYTETYVLYFCSEEMLLSEQYKLCKSYPGQTVSDNIYDILSNELQVNDSNISIIEPTYGIYDFVIPTIKPFDAINWMSNYARPSADKLGADMLFFENKYGFNFRSLQSMMDIQTNPPYASYTYNPKNIEQNTSNQEIYNVTTYEILNSYDTLGSINAGVFANQLLSVDILTRKTKATNFDYANYQTNSTSLNPWPITNNFKNRLGDGLNQSSQAVLKLVFSNFDEQDSKYVDNQEDGSVAPNIFAETYIPYRTAQLQLINYTRIKLSVPGDPGLSIGSTINFSLLNRAPNDGVGNINNREPDSFYSGNYLITAVKHLITFNDYKTIVEIAKDSSAEQYADIDNSNSLWQNTVKGLKNV
jgi:hypothetical protein